MDPTFTSTSRFRFRDHKQELAGDDTSEGHTTADSSGGEDEEEHDFQSMTAKGVQHLCSELLELKQESDEDFQKNIFSNYSAFLAILKEIEGLQNALSELKHEASSQKRIARDVSDGISLRVLSIETIESMLEETIHLQPSSPLETHTETVSEILDTLLSEHRLDNALALLEMEGEFVHNFQDFPLDQQMSYNSTISEKRAMLSDQLTLVAKHPRVSAQELQKALTGLCQLGNNHLATKLMLRYHHSRIESGIHGLESSNIQKAAKFVCSMISQAVRSYVALNGETYSYSTELTEWASEEMETLSVCFSKYVESISDISGGLSTAVNAVQMMMSYCSLLENQRIFLQPCLIEHICPCIEEVLCMHIDHLSNVISIFTSTDNWVLGRYYVSGILTGRSYAIIDQQPEYFYLTNSGRKFVTLFQSVAEDIFPLIALQMESSALKGITDLFTAYIVILESAFTIDTEIIGKRDFGINLPESPTQGVSVLANLSSLVQLLTSIVRDIFDSIHQLDFEIDKYLIFIQDVYSGLKTSFKGQFISNIFSPIVDHQSGPDIGIIWRDGSRICDLIPSVPYLELYLELKKLQGLAEEDSIDMNWLISMLKEVMDATFEWISSKSDIWTINKENLDGHRSEFMQFILDAQFLVELARCGGYLSENVINISTDFISRLEASFISAGLNPLSDSNDPEWPTKAVVRALQKLEELHAKESLDHEPRFSSSISLDDEGIDSLPSTVTVNASEFKTNTQVSRTEEVPIEEVDLEGHSIFCNRELFRQVEIRNEGEKSPEITDL